MENIDKIYYINLDHRTDRRTEIENEFASHFGGTILEQRIERFPAIKHQNGLFGCSISHLEVIKRAKASGSKYVIVFEDDFEFLVSKEIFTENINTLFQQVNNGLDFKVVMLAYNAINRSEIPNNTLLDITTESQTCSGYLVNSKYFDELIQCWEHGVQLYAITGQEWIYCCDQYWKNLQKEKWYLFKTRLGKQRPGFSDNAQAYCNHNC
jgi:GR25 family glycosyltransferase involved in LPS biosynthesis